MTHFDYDFFVIGAGSGGVRASRMASSYGAKVGIAEEAQLGGTCVNLGCIPKKLFVHASHFGESFEDARGFGWSASDVQFDWQTLVKHKDREILRINGVYQNILKSSGVTIYSERAVLEDAHTIRLTSSNTKICAKYILIAPGSKAYFPDIPGIDFAITSNEAFHLESLPKSIAIVGGGYIAVEFAGIFNGLGVKTNLIYRGPHILRGFDHDMRLKAEEEMRTRGIEIILNANPVQISQDKSDYEVSLDTGTTLKTDMVMYATGRVPNTKNLGLESADVKLGKRGEILVNTYYQSSVDSIYAVGDVIDRITLTPTAIREGAAVAETLFNNTPKTVDYQNIPTAVFSQPEIGVVGLTEEEARAQFDHIDIYKSDFRPLKHIISERKTRMMMKLIVNGQTNHVLGCHMIGEASAEIVQLAATAIRMGATKADFDETIALHPSSAEELVTMRQKWVPEASA